MAILVGLKLYQEKVNAVYIAWPWWVVIGTGWTYVAGACFSGKRGPDHSSAGN